MKAEDERLLALYRLRRKIEQFIDDVICALDRIDAVVEDLEDGEEEDDGDGEPSLGATEHIDQRKSWLQTPHSLTPDLEAECGSMSG